MTKKFWLVVGNKKQYDRPGFAHFFIAEVRFYDLNQINLDQMFFKDYTNHHYIWTINEKNVHLPPLGSRHQMLLCGDVCCLLNILTEKKTLKTDTGNISTPIHIIG